MDLLLLESLHDSRPMLGAGSSSGLKSSRSSCVQCCGSLEQTSGCFIVCSSPRSHPICQSSLNPRFCIRALHRPVPVRRRFRLDQVGHASLEPGGSDSLGLNGSLCGVVSRWLDQRVSLRVRALPSRGSTEWRKLCLDFSLFLAGSCSYREDAKGHFLVCVSQAGMRLPIWYVWGGGEFRTASIHMDYNIVWKFAFFSARQLYRFMCY